MRRMLIVGAVLSAVAAPVLAQAVPQKTEQPEEAEKKICKKTVETGSFIKGKKICLTRAQWNRVAEEQSEVARRVVNEGTIRPPGN